jgi:hypothetical protein
MTRTGKDENMKRKDHTRKWIRTCKDEDIARTETRSLEEQGRTGKGHGKDIDGNAARKGKKTWQ